MSVTSRTQAAASPLEIIQRTVAAAVGGYGFAWAASVLLARILPLTRYEATQWAVLASFLFYLLAILWAFRVRPLTRMWGDILAPAAACAALAWWAGPT